MRHPADSIGEWDEWEGRWTFPAPDCHDRSMSSISSPQPRMPLAGPCSSGGGEEIRLKLADSRPPTRTRKLHSVHLRWRILQNGDTHCHWAVPDCFMLFRFLDTSA